MNKSIYDEALESRSHISAIIQNQKTHLTREEEMHHLANITRALLQAEKQEKLLGLYQRLYHDFDDLTMFQQLDIEKQIKELENNEN